MAAAVAAVVARVARVAAGVARALSVVAEAGTERASSVAHAASALSPEPALSPELWRPQKNPSNLISFHFISLRFPHP